MDNIEKIRNIRKGEEKELLKLLSVCLKSASYRYFENYLKYDPNYKKRYTFIYLVNRKIVSSVQLFERYMYYNGQILKVGGIGNVVTDSDFRGRGYASSLLREAEKFMIKNSFDLGLLFTDIQKYYGKLGWWIFPLDVYSIKFNSRFNKRIKYKVKDFNKKYLNEVIKAYNTANTNRNGCFIRGKKFWQVHKRWYEDDIFKIFIKDGRVLGYVRGKRYQDTMNINEISFLTEDIFDDILANVNLFCLKNKINEINFKFDRSHPFIRYLKNSYSNVKHTKSKYMMAKVINSEILKKKLKVRGDIKKYFLSNSFIFNGPDGF